MADLDWSIFFFALAIGGVLILAIESFRRKPNMIDLSDELIYDRPCHCGSGLPTFRLRDDLGEPHSHVCQRCAGDFK